jgi:type III secretion protein C
MPIAATAFRVLTFPARDKRLLAPWVAAALMATAAGPNGAAFALTQAAWFTRPFEYVVINQDVRGILTEFGRNIGIPVMLTDKVSGRLHGDPGDRTAGSSTPQSAGQFLNNLAKANDLTWYFDGAILYVSADQEFSTQLIDVGGLSAQEVIAELKRLSLMDERFAVRAGGNAGTLSVSGPPAFIAIVRQLVEKMRPLPAIAGDDPRVRVFRGGAPAELVLLQSEKARAPRSADAGRSGDGQR